MALKILFSPSESKISQNTSDKFHGKNLIFPEFFSKRTEILGKYDEFLKTASLDEIKKLFGLKHLEECKELRKSIFDKGAIKAILRYDGVAYKHLNYRSLSDKAQSYIDNNVLIFSNLFGPILAKDEIAEYKLKQGEKLAGFEISNFYDKNFSKAVDKFLQNDEVLDLRAKFYEKFYTIKKEYTTFSFMKNKKILSHHAKAYRGNVLREIANNLVNNKDELMGLNFKNLKLIDMKKIGPKTELMFEICE
ncbi:YaaA family protein [Campylobacter sp.]|uniref:YaaA family protein n=1 Tax=Campylobacter sp. TaxID=205 RepID=UPI003F9FEAC8